MRMDEEFDLRNGEKLLSVTWFQTLDWAELHKTKGTTYIQIPKRHNFAVQQAQTAILRVIAMNEPMSLANECGWKLLILSSRLLLGHPEDSRERTCAELLEERLELFWAQQWQELWNQITMETEPKPTIKKQPTPDKKLKAKAMKVSTLTRAGEKGRALAAVRQKPPPPLTKTILK